MNAMTMTNGERRKARKELALACSMIAACTKKSRERGRLERRATELRSALMRDTRAKALAKSAVMPSLTPKDREHAHHD